ncbi:MAG: DUF4232 domain-containing protein [Actinomycetota bacterium]
MTRTVTHTVTTGAATTSTTTASAAPCQASDMSASFAAEPGSAGAGNIVYKLTLTNTSSSPCTVGGLPQVQLQDSNHKNLPTKGTAQFPGANEPVVTVAPSGTAISEARFSPDVNGVGESSNPCEPKAYVLVVSLGGGTVSANIDPPTSVCSHGQLQLTTYSAP